ncbi:MAG TPA: alpha/beta hydrolase-fold protein, partial [Actinomycetota bacterium]
ADRAGRAIGGMSSGGYGALNLGLRHQDRFSVILAQMPYGDPGNVTRILLGGSRALWQANSPRLYIPTMTFHHPVAVYLIAGSRDPQLGEARRLAAMLTGRGQVAVVKAVPGATHSWRGARAEIPYSLVFASQQLHGGSSGGHQLLADATARPPALPRS